MRILLLTHSFNSLSQRLWLELKACGHQVSVELDIADSVAEEAVALWQPDVIVAPFLKRAIPASIWSNHVCLIVHPGIVGDRGPSSLDWAIQEGAAEWGVTVLQANAVMDGGDIWSAQTFVMRAAKKSSIYRSEVAGAAVRGVLEALAHYPDYVRGNWKPTPLSEFKAALRGTERPSIKQVQRAIDWQHDDTVTVLRKINAADGCPGVKDMLFGQPCHLFDARAETGYNGTAGEVLGRCGDALLRATTDGAVWIGHVRRLEHDPGFKLPAAVAFAEEATILPELVRAVPGEIRYEEHGSVGFLHFDFYNGAMSTDQCMRLRQAYVDASKRPTRVLVLMGGEDFWSNGIHLNRIEAADSPADESMRNIEAMDDLALEILRTTEQAHGGRDAGQRRCGRLLPRAGDRSGMGAAGGGAQPALQEHGQPVRFRILDLPAASPCRQGARAGHHAEPLADFGRRCRAGKADRCLLRRRCGCFPRQGQTHGARTGDSAGLFAATRREMHAPYLRRSKETAGRVSCRRTERDEAQFLRLRSQLSLRTASFCLQDPARVHAAPSGGASRIAVTRNGVCMMGQPQ